MNKILDFVDKVASRKSKYKQVILVREDLHLPKGKMSAQVAHASVGAVMKSEEDKKKDIIDAWKKEGMKKVVLRADDLKVLKEFRKRAEEAGLSAVLISDAGHTVIKRGTVTCLGIGPDEESKIDEITGELKVY
ncbi:peptidyl-tRNA hydrolase [Candidatus Woesearchaeota archaeon]|nr:peptidyl-tRNA hydrolase [Candidatus Woesearchaeota archaeon]